jgi:hypothetical protein
MSKKEKKQYCAAQRKQGSGGSQQTESKPSGAGDLSKYGPCGGGKDSNGKNASSSRDRSGDRSGCWNRSQGSSGGSKFGSSSSQDKKKQGGPKTGR